MMNDFSELYKRIEYLRNNGTKMKEIADWVGMAPSVLSSLYTTVLPAYFESAKTMPQEEALDQALSLVNNVSKRKLLSGLENTLNRLDELEPAALHTQKGIPFIESLNEELSLSARKTTNICGLYTSYSLSSSSDCLKCEPYIITLSDNKDHIRIGRLNAYDEVQWGIGVNGDPQNFYCMFSENPVPPLTLVTVYLQIPMFKKPRQRRGLYLGLDYNRNPIARRIIFIKHSDSTNMDDFLELKGAIIPKEELTEEQIPYYNYTCQPGDYIKTCSVPSPSLNEKDLEREKKILAI